MLGHLERWKYKVTGVMQRTQRKEDLRSFPGFCSHPSSPYQEVCGPGSRVTISEPICPACVLILMTDHIKARGRRIHPTTRSEP